MALDFSGASDKVNFGSAAVLDALSIGPSTLLMWVFPDASPPAADGTFVRKSTTGFTFNPDSTGNIQLSITRGTQGLLAQTALANMATYGASKWCCIAATWDSTGANGDQQLWHGDLATPIAEASAYSGVQRVGSGTVTDTTALDFLVGNASTNNRLFDGKVGFIAAWSRRLTLEELIAQQFRPHVTSGCVLFCHLGYNGTGTQPDWSGNGNAGTVTGTAVASHVPLPFRRAGALYVPYRQAAAASARPWWAYTQQVAHLGGPNV